MSSGRFIFNESISQFAGTDKTCAERVEPSLPAIANLGRTADDIRAGFTAVPAFQCRFDRPPRVGCRAEAIGYFGDAVQRGNPDALRPTAAEPLTTATSSTEASAGVAEVK